MKKTILTIFLLSSYLYFCNFINIPNQMIRIKDSSLELIKMPFVSYNEISNVNSNIKGDSSSTIEVKLFGMVKIKNIALSNIDKIKVVPIGKIIGLKMYTDGVFVVGIEDEEKIQDKILEGDTILQINNNIINDSDELKSIVNSSKGDSLKIKLLRDDNIIETNIKPQEIYPNEYRLGVWVKDAATGVGTITFYESKNKTCAVLGHGITDADTSKLINIESGELVTSKILYLEKGGMGTPGEIKGTIVNQLEIGKIISNTPYGVYGTLDNLSALNVDTKNEVEVALRDEITLGNAKIMCSLDNQKVKEYDIEIQKIFYDNDLNNKSMQIKITDKELLEKTGGIIRGLSGAPIMQNGKFIGAVTNVLVSNPEIGYAVFGDIMINQLSKIK